MTLTQPEREAVLTLARKYINCFGNCDCCDFDNAKNNGICFPRQADLMKKRLKL